MWDHCWHCSRLDVAGMKAEEQPSSAAVLVDSGIVAGTGAVDSH